MQINLDINMYTNIYVCEVNRETKFKTEQLRDNGLKMQESCLPSFFFIFWSSPSFSFFFFCTPGVTTYSKKGSDIFAC